MKSTRTRTITISILCLGIAVFLGLWIFFIVGGRALKNESIAIESDSASKMSQGRYFTSIRQALKGSKAELALVDSRFIDKDGIPKFISLLESKSVQSGVDTDFGLIDTLPQTENHSILRVRITGSGSWINTMLFITSLESLPYASEVETISLAKGAEKSNVWGFNLELTMYLEEKK